MKKIFITLLLLVFLAGTAQAAMTYGSANYLKNKQYALSGNKRLDPLYLAINEIDAALTGSSWTAVSGTLTLNHNASTSTIGIGTGTTTGAVTLGGTGTQTIAIGTGNGIKTTNLGSAYSTSVTAINSGTGDMTITSTDLMSLTSTGSMTVAASDWGVLAGAPTFSGLVTGSLGATVTGAAVGLNSGSTAASNYAINIGAGTSTGTVTIGGTGAQSINVGTGAGVKTVALGSTNSTSATTIASGTGNLTVNHNAGTATTGIGTGTTGGAVTIGNTSNTVTIGSPGIFMASGSKIYTTTTILNATATNALYTTAQNVTITPGAQEMIQVLGCEMFYNFGAVFVPGSATDLALKYINKNGTACTDTRAVTGFLDGEADGIASLLPIKIVGAATLFKGAPVCLSCAGDVMTGGTGSTLTVVVTYVVHPTGF